MDLPALRMALLTVGLLLSAYRLGHEMARLEIDPPRLRVGWIFVPLGLVGLALVLLEAGRLFGREAPC